MRIILQPQQQPGQESSATTSSTGEAPPASAPQPPVASSSSTTTTTTTTTSSHQEKPATASTTTDEPKSTRLPKRAGSAVHRKQKSKLRSPAPSAAAAAPSASSSLPPPSLPLPVLPADEGYNSGDEYAPGTVGSVQIPEEVDEDKYATALFKRRGFEIRRMGTDGACLFRAVADQIFGDQELHGMVREQCCSYMEKERDHFSQYVTEEFDEYIARKRRPRVHGNHIEIQAMAELYNRPIEVFCYSFDPINIFQGGYKTDNAPIRVSYHHGNHFNSVVDPNHPAVGVGLGLPGYVPQSIDRIVTDQVSKASEAAHIDSLFVSRAVADSDLADAQSEIEKAVVEASRLEYLTKLCGSIVVPPSAVSPAKPQPSSSFATTPTNPSQHPPPPSQK